MVTFTDFAWYLVELYPIVDETVMSNKVNAIFRHSVFFKFYRVFVDKCYKTMFIN